MDSTTKKPGLSKLAKGGLFFFSVLVIAVLSSKAHKRGSVGPVAQAPDTNEVAVRFVALLIADDIKAGSTGAETMISTVSGSEFLQWAGLGQRVTAKEYEAAYDANEIAADNEFKDKRLLVSGKLAGIEKDFTGEGYLDLAGSNVFLPGVHAQLTQASMAEAAWMKKGQKLDLVCNGAGRVVTIAMLADCQPLPDYLNAITPSVEAKVRDALDGKTPLPPNPLRF